jgi:endonuclease YncB( thermonuclease family)
MFILHRRVENKIQPDIASKSVPTTLVQPEVKSPSSVVQSLPSRGPFRVTRVLDGDTLVLDNGETVRLIGVDAPETHHPEIPVQRFGEESTEFLRRFAEGFECTLEYEPSNIRDQYGRLLAYVFVGDRLTNAEIIRRGYAYAYTRFPFRRQAEFIALEREARGRQYGLWHLSLRDGRIANLVKRYESLSMEGRKRLDEILEELVQKYPFRQKENIDSLTKEKR